MEIYANLFKFNEKYVGNSGFLFGRHSRLMAFTYFKQLLKNALELEFGQKYIFILSSTHISFIENCSVFHLQQKTTTENLRSSQTAR